MSNFRDKQKYQSEDLEHKSLKVKEVIEKVKLNILL